MNPVSTPESPNKLDPVLERLASQHHLDTADRGRLVRFADLIDSSDYQPIQVKDMAARRADVRAGQQMNAIEGNHGSPLGSALLDLLIARRVPADVGTELMAKAIRYRLVLT